MVFIIERERQTWCVKELLVVARIDIGQSPYAHSPRGQHQIGVVIHNPEGLKLKKDALI